MIKRIDFRKGNVSMIIGLWILTTAFVGMAVVVELFDHYYTQAKVQTVTDVIADGSIIAGKTNTDYSLEQLRKTADELLELNGMKGNNSRLDIKADKLIDSNGHLTGEVVSVVDLFYEKEYFFPSFLSPEDRYTIIGHAKVSLVPKSNNEGWIEESFVTTGPWMKPSFLLTDETNRNSAFVSWFISFYLCPEKNPIYAYDGRVKNREFLYDYLVCMGLRQGTNLHIPDVSTDSVDDIVGSIAQSPKWDVLNFNDEIKQAGNDGKPCIAVFRDETGKVRDVYIILTSKGTKDTDIAVARVTKDRNSNRDVIPLTDLEGATIYAHD